jgi:protocatechuate 3,4-dioxygenase beta subunit
VSARFDPSTWRGRRSAQRLAVLVVAALVAVGAVVVLGREGRSTAAPSASPSSVAVTVSTEHSASQSVAPSRTAACAASPGQYDAWDGVLPSNAPSRTMLAPTTGVVRPKPSTKPIPLVLKGRVLDTSCRPIAHAFVWAFHRDPDGNYGPDASPPNDNLFYYQATVETDDAGQFEVTTVRPGAPTGPSHIHVLVAVAGGRSRMSLEIWFADDPRLPSSTSQALVAHPTPRSEGGFEIEIAIVFDPPSAG